ncbi:alpha/beta-hydrolase [Abortiporus biennis]|nr:alpha/beta-hydrolase [Abortiporus biennis]
MWYNFLPAAIQYLIASHVLSEPDVQSNSLIFSPRHHFGLSGTRPVFSDIKPSSQFTTEPFPVNTRTLRTYKARSQDAFFSARFRGGGQNTLRWDESETTGPDIEDRSTLQQLAKMSNNAYGNPGDADWYDLGPEFNTTYPFGWEPDEDGFRGQIFVSEDNSTVIMSIKGTSAGWIVGGGGPTTRKDKLNDNLLFSCCCARVGPTWRPVCGCYEGGYKCDQGCLEQSLVDDSLFYSVGTNLYYNVSYLYPNANIWLTGHSLGGSLASLLGITFGVPVVAFEAPAEKLAAQRLHLPLPLSTEHITHVYHTADPIPMGTCTGVSSSCAIGGYALETRCHLGNVIKYDTVTKLGWSVDVRTHGIAVIVERLLSEDWDTDEGTEETGGRKRTVPEPKEETDCVDCFNWEFGDYRNVSAKGECSSRPLYSP